MAYATAAVRPVPAVRSIIPGTKFCDMVLRPAFCVVLGATPRHHSLRFLPQAAGRLYCRQYHLGRCHVAIQGAVLAIVVVIDPARWYEAQCVAGGCLCCSQQLPILTQYACSQCLPFRAASHG